MKTTPSKAIEYAIDHSRMVKIAPSQWVIEQWNEPARAWFVGQPRGYHGAQAVLRITRVELAAQYLGAEHDQIAAEGNQYENRGGDWKEYARKIRVIPCEGAGT